ncbi:MAG: hypothetical protein HQL67_01020 [Magnetococcales bacterium]|nr:hypothetical protein [Magnetococcales bacterium]
MNTGGALCKNCHSLFGQGPSPEPCCDPFATCSECGTDLMVVYDQLPAETGLLDYPTDISSVSAQKKYSMRPALINLMLLITIFGGGTLFHFHQQNQQAQQESLASSLRLEQIRARQEQSRPSEPDAAAILQSAQQSQIIMASRASSQEIEHSKPLAHSETANPTLQIQPIQEQQPAATLSLSSEILVSSTSVPSKITADTEPLPLQTEVETEPTASPAESASRMEQTHAPIILSQEEPDLSQTRCTGDCQNGTGTFFYKNGDRYEGEWKNGQREGRGKLTYANEDTYTGEWRGGKPFGAGKRELKFSQYYNERAKSAAQALVSERNAPSSWHDESLLSINQLTGNKTVGCVSGNCKNGLGIYQFANGSSYNGYWLNGKKQGKGTYRYSDGSQYIGDWLQDNKHGQGLYIFQRGERYFGSWKDGKKHGTGIILTPDGQKIKTIWNQGKRIA